jgi:hypothetical protein
LNYRLPGEQNFLMFRPRRLSPSCARAEKRRATRIPGQWRGHTNTAKEGATHVAHQPQRRDHLRRWPQVHETAAGAAGKPEHYLPELRAGDRSRHKARQHSTCQAAQVAGEIRAKLALLAPANAAVLRVRRSLRPVFGFGLRPSALPSEVPGGRRHRVPSAGPDRVSRCGSLVSSAQPGDGRAAAVAALAGEDTASAGRNAPASAIASSHVIKGDPRPAVAPSASCAARFKWKRTSAQRDVWDGSTKRLAPRHASNRVSIAPCISALPCHGTSLNAIRQRSKGDGCRLAFSCRGGPRAIVAGTGVGIEVRRSGCGGREFGPDRAVGFLAKHLPLELAARSYLCPHRSAGVHLASPRQALVEVLLIHANELGELLSFGWSNFAHSIQSSGWLAIVKRWAR